MTDTPLTAEVERAITDRLMAHIPTDPDDFPEFCQRVRAQFEGKDATIDAQATEIAALRGALEELRQVYHHVVHRGELDECELLLCQRARRVLAGKEAQG